MSIFVALHHVTHYKYDRPIDLGPQTVRLRPAPHTRTPILSYSLKVTPTNHFVNWQQDPQGNWLARFVFPEKATELKIEVDFSAQMTVVNPFDFFVEGYASTFPFQYTSDLKTELAPYLRHRRSRGRCSRRTLNGYSARGRQHRQFPGRAQRATAEEDQLRHPDGAGHSDAGRDAGCRLRLVPRLGVAVDPYLPSPRPRGAFRLRLSAFSCAPISIRSKGPREVESDFTDLHAWAEVYLPGAGWIGFDVTSGMLTGEGHIPVAATPHYRSAAPIIGSAGFANVEFGFEMSVRRIREAPRITRPFSDESWARLDALGEQVDADLEGW